MNAKLTLLLDKQVIERAKTYAQKTNQSLSSLVRNYLNLISEQHNQDEEEISSIVRELSGIIEVDKNFDLKKEYQSYIVEKYS